MAVSIVITPIVSGVAITENKTTVTSTTLALGSAYAQSMIYEPTGALTATNVQAALDQLAAQDFRSDSAPTGANLEEGDTWYDTDDNQLKVYRETSVGVFQWVPIIVGAAGDDSDTLDAGAF